MRSSDRRIPYVQVIAELRQHRQCVCNADLLPEAAILLCAERFGAKGCIRGLVRLLYQRSGGNPLFFTALVDELLQRGILEGRATVSVREGMAIGRASSQTVFTCSSLSKWSNCRPQDRRSWKPPVWRG